MASIYDKIKEPKKEKSIYDKISSKQAKSEALKKKKKSPICADRNCNNLKHGHSWMKTRGKVEL